MKVEIIVLKEHTKKLREDVDKTSQGDLKTDVTLLKDKVKKLEDAAEKSGNRAWSIVPNLIGALVDVLLGAAIAYWVAKKTP